MYEQLATIRDEGAVIEVPFGIGDGLTAGQGSQDRRLLYHATIHGHPVVGGYIGRMPPAVAQAYDAMPVIGNLLRLSNGGEAIEDDSRAGASIPLSGARYRHRAAEDRRIRQVGAGHGSHHACRRQRVIRGAGDEAGECQSVQMMTAKHVVPEASASHPQPRVTGKLHHISSPLKIHKMSATETTSTTTAHTESQNPPMS